jgi:hypothetical protein
MRDAFNRIRLTVRVIVRGINFPLIAGLMMMRMANAIHGGIAQIDIRRGHVDLGAQYARAFGQRAAAHLFEQRQVFFHAAIAIGTVAARLS